jgi:hypothetical protein
LPALTVAALTMGGYGFLGLQTPLVWIEILLLIQGLSIGMVIGPVTAALISNLPLEQAGAGSAVTNTVRQTGSVIGIAVGGTIMSIMYRRAIEPSLEGAPGPVQAQARVSAEQARHVATAIHRPTLAQAADNAFIRYRSRTTKRPAAPRPGPPRRHEACHEDLAAHFARVHTDGSLPGELLGLVDRSSHTIDENPAQLHAQRDRPRSRSA